MRTLLFCGLLIGSCVADGGNLLKNGSFELGSPGGVPENWHFAASGAAQAEIAVTVKKDDREALRECLGDELLRYAVLRGRWQAGSLAADLKVLCVGLPLPDAVMRLSHLTAVLLWTDWPEGLREKTAARFAPHREAVGETPDDPVLRRRVRAFLLKLIRSEGDEACRNLFK